MDDRQGARAYLGVHGGHWQNEIKLSVGSGEATPLNGSDASEAALALRVAGDCDHVVDPLDLSREQTPPVPHWLSLSLETQVVRSGEVMSRHP